MLSSFRSSGEGSFAPLHRVAILDTPVKRKVVILENKSSIGDRLMEAFETTDKEIIAKSLGFETKRAIYKVINGERELDFQKLLNFRERTKCSIDWLLTGEGPKRVDASKGFDLEYAIEQNDDWVDVLEQWYEFEGRKMPEDLGARFMGGWRGMTKKEKVDALTDLKELVDKTVARDEGRGTSE